MWRSYRIARLSSKSERTYTHGCRPVVGRSPWIAGDPPVAHPALDHRYSLGSLTLNVVPYLLKLALMPHQMVIALFLPKGTARQCQHRSPSNGEFSTETSRPGVVCGTGVPPHLFQA